MPYPPGLQLTIDAVPFVTTGRAVKETLDGTYYSRTWVAVQPATTNGNGHHHSRLVDERGIKGLKERADRERLHTQRQEQD